MKRLTLKHPLAIRWFHWVNFPLLALMIYSGLLIYWANDVYPFGESSASSDPKLHGWHALHAFGWRAFHFFPPSFYSKLHLGSRLAEGMAWHFFFMWLFMVNGLLYVAYTALSGEWRYLLPLKGSLKNAWQTVLHDLHLSKYEPPIDKYNGAQRIAYTGVVLMGGGSLITGLAIYKPAQVAWLAHLCGGYTAARMEHFYLTLLYVLFFLVHVGQVVKTGWNNFRSMISGYDLSTVKEATHVVAE